MAPNAGRPEQPSTRTAPRAGTSRCRLGATAVVGGASGRSGIPAGRRYEKSARAAKPHTRRRPGNTISLVRNQKTPHAPRRELERRPALRPGLASGDVESHFHVEGDLSDLGLGPGHVLAPSAEEKVHRRTALYTALGGRAKKKMTPPRNRPANWLPVTPRLRRRRSAATRPSGPRDRSVPPQPGAVAWAAAPPRPALPDAAAVPVGALEAAAPDLTPPACSKRARASGRPGCRACGPLRGLPPPGDSPGRIVLA